MPLSAQVRLLRVLENRPITRVGSPNAVQLDVRIIASTHADLHRKVKEGTFRRDLWYRLSVFPIHVPPLRERKEDIPTLLRHFLHTKAKQFDLPETIRVPKEELARLYAYNWPGNVRELDHVVERAMILARGKSGTLHFDIERDEFEESSWSAPEENASDWPTLAEMENRYIRAVLAKCGGKLTGENSVTQVLGIHYTTLRAGEFSDSFFPHRRGRLYPKRDAPFMERPLNFHIPSVHHAVGTGMTASPSRTPQPSAISEQTISTASP